MPTLEDDELVFRFPHIEPEAQFSIDIQRTLRIPDTDESYPLPPGLGSFPLLHVDDYADRLPTATVERGGVFLPIWQSEALWLNFSNEGYRGELEFPVAIKVAAGKINAVTGESWRSGLSRNPQDYMVSPDQPWLDGFAVEKGIIRQFVAMPLGDGYSVEEQLTGRAEWGGLQIVVIPLKQAIWQRIKDEWANSVRIEENKAMPVEYSMASMGLGAGGRMRQSIYPDPYRLSDWDLESSQRVFITLQHARDWENITGKAPPKKPPTAEDYNDVGLPWFQYYGNDQVALSGGKLFKGISSVASIFKSKHSQQMPNSGKISVSKVQPITSGKLKGRPVRTSEF
jgi:hypothetical protein